ncbi:unnamed protein product [Porites lobata]|uniref:Uncharacterized protein n=1 Tax=Porites lobata TaxID=104759 RepID=A0ABN8NW31_9CNID|nr:unnamed protein product [Porites lobata]
MEPREHEHWPFVELDGLSDSGFEDLLCKYSGDVDESFINRCHFIKKVLPESSLNNHMGLLQSSNDGSSNACQAQKSLFIESKSELKA